MRNVLLICMIAGLALAGCGRKEPPQPVASKPPQLVHLEHALHINSLEINVVVTGQARGVGYQVDRAEFDPYCKCPNFWRRYFERTPVPKQSGKVLTKLINVGQGKKAYYFRVRAIDSLGRFSAWSKPFLVRGEKVHL